MIPSETKAAAQEKIGEPSRSGLERAISRYVPLLIWIIVVMTLILIPAKIISYGYLPQDDALRHAAKAVSAKPWSEILVMRNDFLIDPHPGWHAILGLVHHLQNSGPEALVVLSVTGLSILFSVVVLPWLKNPETWLAALVIAGICVPRMISRLSLGRPFLVTVSFFLLLILMWTRLGERKPSPPHLVLSILLIAFAAWVHGGWYQFCLPVGGLLFAGRWRAAGWYAGCWVAGSFAGCALTGHPWQFLYQSVRHLFGVFGDYHVARELSAELLPSGGDPLIVLVVIAVLLWRARSPGWTARELLNPIFMMAAIGWLLGLRMYRFWDDWGLPATMLWLALELQQQLQLFVSFDSLRRLMITGALALAAFFSATSDISSRYTWNLTNEYLTQDNPELTGWLPDPGGILYSADMRVFNETFFKSPTAPWKYVLGFEPALMQPEDLAVLRKVQWNFGDVRAYEPWVSKMRPQDRLVLRASWLHTPGAPNIPELEWKYAVSDLWVGRLPRAANPPGSTK
jgi:hypothetical protein